MSGPNKPTMFIDWTPSGASPEVTQPPTSLQNSGWLPGEAPPPDYLNWLFYILDQWTQWLDYQVENVIDIATGISASSIALNTTGTWTNGGNSITGLASTAGIVRGQLVTGTGIPSSTFVLSLSGSTVLLSNYTTSNQTTAAVSFVHQWATGANVQLQLDELDAAINVWIHALLTTGNLVINTTQISTLASTTSLLVGMAVSGTGIPAGAYIIAISGSTATMSIPATASGTGVSLTFGNNYATGDSVTRHIQHLDAAVRARQSVGGNGVVAVAANFNITSAYGGFCINVNSSAGPLSLQLPDPTTVEGIPFTIVDAGFSFGINNVTLVRFGSEQLLGLAASYVMAASGFMGTFYSNGTNWFRLN